MCADSLAFLLLLRVVLQQVWQKVREFVIIFDFDSCQEYEQVTQIYDEPT